MNVCVICDFGSKLRPITFGCIAMGSAVLFILRPRLLFYSAGSGVNRVQVVLSVCSYGCMHFKAALVLTCVVVMIMSSALTMT